MPEANDNTKIKFSRDYSVPRPLTEPAYFIPVGEWERLKRMISKITPPKNWFQIVGSLLAGTSIASLIGIWQSDNPSFHYKLVAWVVVVCGAVLALALFYLDGQQRRDITQSAKSVTDEMMELEKSYAGRDADVEDKRDI